MSFAANPGLFRKDIRHSSLVIRHSWCGKVSGRKENRNPQGRTKAPWLLLGLIAAASIVAYQGIFTAPFIFDDKSSILGNPGLRSLWPIWPALWAPKQMAIAGRPVVSLSFALNYAFGGYDVWGYHAFNLAVHIANAFLIYALVRRALTSDAASVRQGPPSEWLAGAAALLWSVHPLLSESVVYVMQRTELLMAFFLLLTIYSLHRAFESPSRRRWPALAIVSCALGMGCKEVMAAAPLLALLYDRIFLSSSFREMFRKRGRLHAGLVSTWLILAALMVTGPRSLSVGVSFQNVRPWEYLLTQAGVIVLYLRLSLFPYPLCLDYSDWPIVRTFLASLPSSAVILALLVLSGWALLRKPRLGYLGAWFFLILAPSSSVIPIVTEPAAERRMYLPLIPIVLLAVLGVHRLAGRLRQETRVRRAEFIVLAGVTAIFVIATSVRADSYSSEASVWWDVLAKRPRNARAFNNLGAVLAKEGRIGEALPLFRSALEIDPLYPEAHNNLGGAEYNLGRMAEAITDFSEAVRLRPDYGEAHLNLGLALHNRGRLDEAIAQYELALKLNPGDPEAHNHLGAALLSRGRIQEAVVHFREALRLRPGYPEAQQNLDRALSGK